MLFRSKAMAALELSSEHLVQGKQPTQMGQLIIDYFQYRADVLNDYVRPRLMELAEAKATYEAMRAQHKPVLAPSMNKQKGEMRQVAYLASLVNVIVESVAGWDGFNPNPLQLTTFTHNGLPVRTLSRRVDGALPGVVNPVALWEVKEYYHNKTFGSRIADAVYETQLDGMELEEMLEHTDRFCEHMLVIDSYNTWWNMGRAQLCRMIDILSMGYVDEILFGREAIERLPALVAGWEQKAKQNLAHEPQIRGAEGDAPSELDEKKDGQGLLDI